MTAKLLKMSAPIVVFLVLTPQAGSYMAADDQSTFCGTANNQRRCTVRQAASPKINKRTKRMHTRPYSTGPDRRLKFKQERISSRNSRIATTSHLVHGDIDLRTGNRATGDVDKITRGQRTVSIRQRGRALFVEHVHSAPGPIDHARCGATNAEGVEAYAHQRYHSIPTHSNLPGDGRRHVGSKERQTFPAQRYQRPTPTMTSMDEAPHRADAGRAIMSNPDPVDYYLLRECG